jgi:hypothetical protein
MQTRGGLPQQRDLLGTEALPRGVGMARPDLLAIKGRVSQTTRGGHRLCPAMTRRRKTADRRLTQPR